MTSCNTNMSNTPLLNGDNFKHFISFSDIIDGVRTLISLENVNISIKYYTQLSEKIYLASKTNNTYVNCILDSENNRLKVIFNNYNLDNGVLLCNVEISIPDTDYPGGHATYTRYLNVGVELVNDQYFING